MTQKSDIMWRIAVAHKIHKSFCEKTNSARCIKRAYDLFGMYVCSVSDKTFYRYVRTPVPETYKLPPWIEDGIDCMVLSNLKHPITLTEDEAMEFIKEIAEVEQ